jgi:hypothetical protein
MMAARIWRGVGEDLTPSRIPNLNAIVVWKKLFGRTGYRPEEGPFGVRELCSRFYCVGVFDKTIVFLAAETSKAAAEPPHSKKAQLG